MFVTQQGAWQVNDAGPRHATPTVSVYVLQNATISILRLANDSTLICMSTKPLTLHHGFLLLPLLYMCMTNHIFLSMTAALRQPTCNVQLHRG